MRLPLVQCFPLPASYQTAIETIDACFRDVRLLRDQSGDDIGPAGSSLRSQPPEKTKKRPRQRRGPRQNVSLEWYVSRLSLGAGSDCCRLLRSTIQLANYVRSDLPRREFDARGFLAFADFPLVAAAQKQARNKHSIASAKGRYCVVHAIEADDTVPVGLQLPLALSVLPSTSRGHGQDRARGAICSRRAAPGPAPSCR
jgi:hypothetical protein